MDRKVNSSITQEMQRCIEECQGCHEVCVETTIHCLEMGGEHSSPAHISLMLDCAQICETSADFMLRASPLHMRTCEVCADVCEQCAESCEMFADDEMMQKCAETCRSCAESCRVMAGGS